LEQGGVACTRVNKVKEGRPHIVDMIKNDEVQLVVNTTEGKSAIAESLSIRSAAIQRKLTYFTTIAGARASCAALPHLHNIEVSRLQDLHRELDV
jgi:carbamoyl-phosphate synthase large subunit